VFVVPWNGRQSSLRRGSSRPSANILFNAKARPFPQPRSDEKKLGNPKTRQPSPGRQITSRFPISFRKQSKPKWIPFFCVGKASLRYHRSPLHEASETGSAEPQSSVNCAQDPLLPRKNMDRSLDLSVSSLWWWHGKISTGKCLITMHVLT